MNIKKLYRGVGFLIACAFMLFSVISWMPVRVYADTDIPAVRDSLFCTLIDQDEENGNAAMWAVFAAVRGENGLSEDYLERYYGSIVDELVQNDWNIAEGRYTEYSKRILMLTAMGYDARSVEGHDLLSYLSDLDVIKNQGLNGVIYALIAANCRDEYEIPVVDGVSTQNSKELMLDFLLDNEADDGGWRIMGGYADVDVTSMAIQALAPYYDSDERVHEKVDRAVKWLSENQQDNGGYMALLGNARVESSESTSQVVLALTSLGIDPRKDERFISASGKTMVDRMMEHFICYEDGTCGFAHILPSEGDPEINGLATVEGFCAVVSLYRMDKGLSSFYDLRDVRVGTTADTAADGNADGFNDPELPDKTDVSSDKSDGSIRGENSDGYDNTAISGGPQSLEKAEQPDNGTRMTGFLCIIVLSAAPVTMWAAWMIASFVKKRSGKTDAHGEDEDKEEKGK